MRTICPNCKTQLTLDTIDGSKTIYKCLNCNELLYLSDLFDINEAEKLLLQPPKGIWIKKKKRRIVINVPVTLNKISYIFFFIFVLIIFSIFFAPLLWIFFNINFNEKIIYIINIFIGILCSIIGVLFLFSPLRKLFYSIFQRIKIVFTENTIYIYRGLGVKNEYVNTNLIKKIYSIKSIEKYKDFNGGTDINDIERKIYMEIENGKTIEISTSDVNEVNSKYLLLMLKYFSFKKQGI